MMHILKECGIIASEIVYPCVPFQLGKQLKEYNPLYKPEDAIIPHGNKLDTVRRALNGA